MKQINIGQKQQGAFLAIALMLLLVLTGIGIAATSSSISSRRLAQNYANYIKADIKAVSMVGYSLRMLQSYSDRKYPEPLSCASGCGTANNSFPYSGRYSLVWTNPGSASMVGTSESNSWWSTNGIAYSGTFSGSSNARTIITEKAANRSSLSYPYANTYRVVGYATDDSGKIRSTYELFHVWKGHPPIKSSISGSACTGCSWGQCCNTSNVCGSSQTDCENGSAVYTPPGYTCAEYFESGLGYSSSACDTFHSYVTGIMGVTYNNTDLSWVENTILDTGAIPASGSFSEQGISSYYRTGDYAFFPYEGTSGITARIQEQNIPGNLLASVQNNFYFKAYPALDGEAFRWSCVTFDTGYTTKDYLPISCDDTTAAYYPEP